MAIKLGEKVRQLHLDVNAFAEIEEATGKNPFDDADIFKVSPTGLRRLIWAALYKEDPRPTLLEVGEWISLSNMGELQRSVAEAQRQAVPMAEPGAAKRSPRNGR